MTARRTDKSTATTAMQAADASVQDRIFSLRGETVILDSDLAAIYGVETKRLNEQVRRNPDRFPPDFAFVLNLQEVENLRSQFATSSLHGGRRYAPRVFTEHGALAILLEPEEVVQASRLPLLFHCGSRDGCTTFCTAKQKQAKQSEFMTDNLQTGR